MFRSKAKRRRQIRDHSFPEDRKRFLTQNVPLVRRLSAEDRDELYGHIQVLLAEKHFEGASGLELSDEIKLVVCAQASILLLHRETDYYPKLISILIYPGPYAARHPVRDPRGVVSNVLETRAGESWTSGTLILSWENVQRDLMATGRAENVVLHEFAHQLDAGSGAMNGAPILSERELQKVWPEALRRAFERLEAATQAHERSVLRPYGAKNPSEFFAVSTEAFFMQPRILKQHEPELYGALCQYYKQDPADR